VLTVLPKVVQIEEKMPYQKEGGRGAGGFSIAVHVNREEGER